MKFLKAIWQHVFVNWKELYIVFPVTIIFITLTKMYYAYQTGHNPTIAEGSLDWLPAMQPRIVTISIAIVLTSLFTECVQGFWLTKEEALAHPWNAIAAKAATCFLMWLFIHTLSN